MTRIRTGQRLSAGLALILVACTTQPDVSGTPSGSGTASAGPAASRPLSDLAPSDLFYPADEVVAAAAPGDLLASFEVRGRAGMRAWIVVYGSTGLDGAPVAVSGVVLAPAEPPATGSYPVVAWAHGTTGIADRCAPTREGLSAIPDEVRSLVEAGYVVTATDYEGLGTDGTHPYLVGVSEGRSVLDSIRAVASLPDARAGEETVIIGHSQGGHAALWAGELAPTYAPELDLRGAMAASPPTDMAAFQTSTFEQAARGRIFTAIAPILYAGVWSEVYDLPLDFLTDAGREAALAGVDACFPEYALTVTPFLADPATLPDWAARLAENSPGLARSDVPMLVVAALGDQLVSDDTTVAGVAKMCAAGDTVELRIVVGNHDASIYDPASWDAIVDWIAQRIAGEPAVSTC